MTQKSEARGANSTGEGAEGDYAESRGGDDDHLGPFPRRKL